MEKTKIETFVEQNGLIAEIKIDPKGCGVMIYRKTDLYLYSEYSETLNGAIQKAVDRYYKRKDLGFEFKEK